MSFFLKPWVCVDQRFGPLGPLGTTLDASQVPRVDVRRAGDPAQNVGSRSLLAAVRCHVGAPISGGRIPSTASIAGGCRSQRFGPLLETE